MLRVRGLAVRGEVRDGLVQRLGLGGLVLDILILHRPGHLVLLGDLVVLRLCIVLFALLLGQILGEVRLHHLEDAEDAGAGARGRRVLLGRGRLLHEGAERGGVLHEGGTTAVVVAENAESLTHAVEAQFQVRLGFDEVLVRGGAERVHLGLLLHQLRERRPKLLHLGPEVSRLGSRLVDLGGHLGQIIVQLALLGLCLRDLLIAIGLLRRLTRGFALQLGNHISDQRLHLGKGVLAGGGAETDHRRDAGGELRQGRGMVILGQALDQGDDLRPCKIRAGLHRRAGVHLEQRVGLLDRPRRRLRQDLLRGGDGLQLLAARGHSRLVVRRRRHARRLGSVLIRQGVRQVPLRDLQIALGRGLALHGGGLLGLLVVHVLGVLVHLVLQRLREHFVIMLCIDLCLAHVCELALGLLLEVLQDVDDASAVRLVRRGRRRSELHVVVLAGLMALHEPQELLRVRGRHGRSIQHLAQRVQGVGQVRRYRRLGKGRVLRHLLLQHVDRTVDGVNGVHELVLAGRKVRRLLVADERRVLMFCVRLRDGGREVRDPGVGHGDVAGQVTDLGLQLVLLGLRGLDVLLAILGDVVAPLEERLVGLQLGLALRHDLGLQPPEQVQDLGKRICVQTQTGSDEQQRRKAEDSATLHCH
mmetsp:Transcript_110384/g.355969  ORF Transcript_110384/g.355969 Transcript_110384/m.355969 type:complete len:644 (-) Transcript_110384:51-1982(-)